MRQAEAAFAVDVPLGDQAWGPALGEEAASGGVDDGRFRNPRGTDHAEHDSGRR
ncbi:hypothetical protein [Streptomyces sp. cg35]|uniref:hypothetical protein n=1 Tax=Streptomyces sp. cg35 TaxID=3421650 RepID=UPI003D1867E4